jgi:hypothetical protein
MILVHQQGENTMAKRHRVSAMKASHLKKGRRKGGRKGRGKQDGQHRKVQPTASFFFVSFLLHMHIIRIMHYQAFFFSLKTL